MFIEKINQRVDGLYDTFDCLFDQIACWFEGIEDIFLGKGVWIVVLVGLFVLFRDQFEDIELCDWIPFLIILLILCACGENSYE